MAGIAVAAVAGIAVAVVVVGIAGIVVAVVTDTVADTEGQWPLFPAWKVAVYIVVNRWKVEGTSLVAGPGPHNYFRNSMFLLQTCSS